MSIARLKNLNASELGKLRWRGIESSDRSNYMSRIAKLPRKKKNKRAKKKTV